MNTNSSQNRALAIIGIVAIILGLGVGLLWAGVGSSAPTSPSAPLASNQNNAQTPSTTATPSDDSAIPTVITGNTGEAAAPSGNNSTAQSTPSDSGSANSNSPSSTATPGSINDNSTSGNSSNGSATDNSTSGNVISGNTNPTTNSGSAGNSTGQATNGTANSGTTNSSTPTSGSATPKRKKTTANTKANGTPTAGKGKAAGKAPANTAAGRNLGNQVAVAGVVDSIDAANKIVVLDTNFGPLSATLATTATIQRLPLPGDTSAAGPIDLSNVQVGNYAIVLVNRNQLPQPASNVAPKKQANATPTPGAIGTPGANDPNSAAAQAKNRDTLVKRRFGILDGFSATVSAMRIGPAPASIEASDSNRLLGLRAIPASFVALNSDGSLLVTITKYGNLTVIVGPGTRFDRLGQPISATDLKPGDSLVLYGEAAWVGTNNSSTAMNNANGAGGKTAPIAPPPGGKGTGKGPYANGLPIVERIAELHVVTTNEHVLQGKVTSVDTSASTFQISSATNETFTVTVAADTTYQSLAAGQSISSLSDLQPGSSVVVYTIGNSDIDPTISYAKTVDMMPATT